MRSRSLANLALAALFAASPTTQLMAAFDAGSAPTSADRPLETSPPEATETASGRLRPDRVGELVGGIAARLHVDDSTPVAGEVYMLMAKPGSEKLARVYDETPYVPSSERDRPDTDHSNLVAAELVSDIVALPLEPRDLTTAPGGGPSAGVAYALAYLNIETAGAVTGDVVVAATGELMPSGWLLRIRGIDEKLTAAVLAGADVLFTPSRPTSDLVEQHTARMVGEEPLIRQADAPGGRGWERYRAWGANSPDDGTDLVVVRHLGEVIAYLCGAGAQPACDAAVELAGPTGPWSAEPAARVVGAAKQLGRLAGAPR